MNEVEKFKRDSNREIALLLFIIAIVVFVLITLNC